uniref:4-alpha-glucanotransferase n=1 Tax=uncultured Enterobacter sp. TaxID=238202 RepID=A0A060BYH5_9ENTR|nr:Glyco_hydro_77 [uncultured Enterobacter sp.]
MLALESQRHRCMVIGEDLGTVPVEIVGKLRKSGVYSYKVLYFEMTTKDFPRAEGVSAAINGCGNDARSANAARLLGKWRPDAGEIAGTVSG